MFTWIFTGEMNPAAGAFLVSVAAIAYFRMLRP